MSESESKMGTTVDLVSEPGIAVAIGHGAMKASDVLEGAAKLWKATDGKTTRMLWDLRDVTLELTAEDVQKLADFVKDLIRGPKLRSAFVVSGDYEFGLLRMFQSLREAPGSQTQVFRDRESAVEWLREA